MTKKTRIYNGEQTVSSISGIVTPLHTSLQMQTFNDANMHSHVQSRKLVHMSGVHCHLRASSTSGCAFVYFIVQYCIDYSSTLYFKPRMSRSKHKSSGDVAGTTYFSRYCAVRLKMFSLFFVFVYFLCIICVKSIINLLQYSTI